MIHVGVIPCGGENCFNSEVSQCAVNRVLNELRKGETFTVSLPLPDADNERDMKLLKSFPIVTVDGCEKQCAKKMLKKHGINATKTITVTKIAGIGQTSGRTASIKNLNSEQNTMVNMIIIKVIDKFNEIIYEDYF